MISNRKVSIVLSMLFSGLMLTACETSRGTVEAPASTSAHAVSTEVGNAREVVMYKSPSCECCTGWAEHLTQAGFTVKVNKREDMDAIKVQYGVPKRLTSCHTALIGGYIIEGHVPAADVERLLKEKPAIAGLTAPGMPQHSPGMQAKWLPPKGYAVLAFDKNGSTHIFTQY